MNCKTNHLDHKNVYEVKSLEEARRILSSAENMEIKDLLKRGFITIWVLTVNRLLGILKFLLFKKWRYTEREFKSIVVYTVGIVGDNVVIGQGLKFGAGSKLWPGTVVEPPKES